MSTDNTSNTDGTKLYSLQPYSAQALSTSGTAQLTTGSGGLDLLDPPIPGYAPLPSRASQMRADFNGDGQEDLLWRNYSSGQNALWFMNGTIMTTSVSLPIVKDVNWRIQGTGDFTGDGQIDILWRNYTTGQNTIWVMNGAVEVSAISLSVVKGANWQIQGTGDFTGDGQIDILWRNYDTGQNVVWAMDSTTITTGISLTTAPGSNLRIAATGDFNEDGQVDILWRNYLSGDNSVWLMNQTAISSVAALTPVSDLNWQIRGAGDYDNDNKLDIVWRNAASGEGFVWLMDNLALSQRASLPTVSNLSWQIGQQDVFAAPSLVTISNLSFNKSEGDTGTFQIQLKQAPAANVTVTFDPGNFLTVDADNKIQNGTQNTITFTPTNWNRPQSIWFIAEADGSSADRLMNNTIDYILSGNLSARGTVDLGSVSNTYAPDPTRFNIDLDFRNDYAGFWTPTRRTIAQQAANDWAKAIANEWKDFQLDSTLGRLETGSARTNRFASQRYVDDLVIFVNDFLGSSNGEAALGGPDYEFGGWITSPELMPRVGQIAISPSVFGNQPDQFLYDVVSHEIGHVLGLVGLNWLSYSLEDRTNPQKATFNGAYSTKANNGNTIPLQSQNGGDFAHPADQVRSIMSYGWIYGLSGPTAIDYAMLADSGYRVYGVTDLAASNSSNNGNVKGDSTGSSDSSTRAVPAADSPENASTEATATVTGNPSTAAAPQIFCHCPFCSASAESLNLLGRSSLSQALTLC
jgi:hypothetical protein